MDFGHISLLETPPLLEASGQTALPELACRSLSAAAQTAAILNRLRDLGCWCRSGVRPSALGRLRWPSLTARLASLQEHREGPGAPLRERSHFGRDGSFYI